MKYIECISQFDTIEKKDFFIERVADALNSVVKSYPEETDVVECFYERMAFSLVGNQAQNSYFGARQYGVYDDGSPYQNPNIDLINSDMVEYWLKRSKDVVNPILQGRYLGLVYCFASALNRKANLRELAVDYVKALLNCLENGYVTFVLDVKIKFKRAFDVIKRMKLEELILECISATISFELSNANDKQGGTWGYAFDYIISDKKMLTYCDDNQKQIIIENLEDRFSRLLVDYGDDSSSIRPLESIADRLIPYYNSIADKVSSKRLCDAYIRKYQEVSDAYDDVFQKVAALEDIVAFLNKYGCREEKKTILVQLKKLAPEVIPNLIRRQNMFTIHTSGYGDFCRKIFIGTDRHILGRLSGIFIPLISVTKESLEENKRNYPLMAMVSSSIIGNDGFVTSRINEPNDVKLGRMIHGTIHEKINIRSNMYMSLLLDQMKKENLWSAEDISNLLDGSSFFDDGRKKIVRTALEAYFSNDRIVAIHLLVPQIEFFIRKIVEDSGECIIAENRFDGYNVMTMGAALEQDCMKEVLGDDLVLYLKSTFTDPRGINLRNRLCHGMMIETDFDGLNADKVFHSFLCVIGKVIIE